MFGYGPPVVNMKVGIQGMSQFVWRWNILQSLTLNKPLVWWNLRWIRVGCNVGCQGYCSHLQGNCCFDETDSTYSVAGIEAWNPPNCRPPVSWRCWEGDGTSWKVSEKQPINPWRCRGYQEQVDTSRHTMLCQQNSHFYIPVFVQQSGHTYVTQK